MTDAMSAEDRRTFGEMIRFWRFINHKLNGTLVPCAESESRHFEALRLARVIGVKAEYVQAAISMPVLTVRVKELE